MGNRIAAASIVVLAGAGQLFGWGREGHRLVAEIAERRLTEKTRIAIAALLGPGESIQSVSAWADEVRPNRRETSTWHFINIPTTATKGDYRPYCPSTGCVVEIIGQMTNKLRNRDLPKQERYEALKFLVHFVGDLHQPLHSADQNDRGGNDVQVVFQNRPTNLHSLWDTPMLDLALTRNPELRVRIGQGPKRQTAKKMQKGEAADWVWDSHAVSRDVVYAGLPAARPAPISEEYWQKAMPLIRLQLERGGIRLAKVLNDALGQ